MTRKRVTFEYEEGRQHGPLAHMMTLEEHVKHLGGVDPLSVSVEVLPEVLPESPIVEEFTIRLRVTSPASLGRSGEVGRPWMANTCRDVVASHLHQDRKVEAIT